SWACRLLVVWRLKAGQPDHVRSEVVGRPPGLNEPDGSFNDRRMIEARLQNPREPAEDFVRRNEIEMAEQPECLRIAHAMRRRTDFPKDDAAGAAGTAVFKYSLAGNKQMVIPA